MHIKDLEDETTVNDVGELRVCLAFRRTGRYGSFELKHEGMPGGLGILINGDLAFVDYHCDDELDEPFYYCVGMTPRGCPESVHFLQRGGEYGNSFDLPANRILPTEIAYLAAEEYFTHKRMPTCVAWERML